MKYIDGFRNPAVARVLCGRIEALAHRMPAGRHVTVMEVCGSHTMAIARYGLRELLPGGVALVSGPGCPVCVTPPGYIDGAIELARNGVVVVTFGDMLHVPGSDDTLATCRSQGGDIRVCYSPDNALDLAVAHPGKEVVFLAIGFETTVAPVVSILDKAKALGCANLSLLTAFKCVPPALSALIDDPEVAVDAFLCPAHVSAIIGADAYAPFAQRGMACVIAGFEPLDILYAIEGILRQHVQGESEVENQYSRVVKPEGNRKAQRMIETFLDPYDAVWRAIGILPSSGMKLRKRYGNYDAERRFALNIQAGRTQPACRCGDVIKGKIRPPECPLFATTCTPDSAVGPCMVSSEGTCSAYFKYARLREDDVT